MFRLTDHEIQEVTGLGQFVMDCETMLAAYRSLNAWHPQCWVSPTELAGAHSTVKGCRWRYAINWSKEPAFQVASDGHQRCGIDARSALTKSLP